ncbi:MAG: DUF502 domain-containing protein [Limnochordales bacterium]|nr:hypothetical protein [Bacillota bacterium]REJ37580.1 MAG: DUF502 domain-containing protein [Bacillota bacterium]
MANRLVPLLRNYFITGLFVSLPLVVTIWVLWLVFRTVESTLGAFLAWIIGLVTGEPRHIPGVGLVLTAVVLVLVGMVATNVVGRRLVAAGERILLMFPVVRPLYTSIKQVIEAFGVKRSSFREVVLLEYPRKGLYTIGFVTNEGRGEIAAHFSEPVKIVFVPTVPNPTSGFVIVAPERELIPLRMSTEEAFKLVLSGGVLVPEDMPSNAGGPPAAG